MLLSIFSFLGTAAFLNSFVINSEYCCAEISSSIPCRKRYSAAQGWSKLSIYAQFDVRVIGFGRGVRHDALSSATCVCAGGH